MIVVAIIVLTCAVVMVFCAVDQRRRRVAERNWRTSMEPLLRNSSGYPADWQRRRALVWIRAHGRCELCLRRIGRLSCGHDEIWVLPPEEHLLFGAQVHHIQHRLRGGDHSMENLRLICDQCHAAEHPGNQNLRELAAASRAKASRRRGHRWGTATSGGVTQRRRWAH